MKIAFTIITFFVSVTCVAQTKLISHKSHSGSNSNFRLALNKNLFDIEQSNFGLVTKIIKNKVDTVTLNANNTIFIHRTVVQEVNGRTIQKAFVQTINKNNQPQFFKVSSQENLKKLIKKTFNFNADSAAFIGFDNKFFKIKN